MKKEKRYEIPEQGRSMVSEPMTGSELLQEVPSFSVGMNDEGQPGTFGFYTDNPDEFELRKKLLIAEAQQQDHAISSEQMWGELRSNLQWLK